ncbi:MAG: 16S rRNA (guanine(966)-N(2))-methyltransferase RsmD [Deltaproteobacteria bacterium]|nr:16S rRNA (guanine(966)-N(2))-methyltransferase RsmD [Deltaproteobacteria bacterium]
MRVVSGICKGKRLLSLKGLALRPTADRVKEAIFDILQDRFQGQRVLDLFAGTGALGIEALSRGACFAVFVEAQVASQEILQKNIENCGFGKQAEILARDVATGIKVLKYREEAFDLIFLDPPYGKGWGRNTLKALSQNSILTPDTRIIAEHSLDEDLEPTPSLERVDQRKYGRTLVSFFQPVKNDDLLKSH